MARIRAPWGVERYETRGNAVMQAREPQVSIGMPVYNGKQFLRTAIDSVLAQTYEDFELVISNNGSTDGSDDICRWYVARDSRIRYFNSATNHGLSWNFNRVVQLATGRYFRWQSYDDACYPQLLAKCVEVLERQPEVVLTFGRTTLLADNGSTTLHDEHLDLQSTSPYRRYRQYLWHYRYGALCNVLFGLIRTSVLRETQLIARFVDSDVVLIGDLALRGAFYEIPEPLFVRRMHPRITTRANPGYRGRRLVVDPAWHGIALHPELRLLIEHFKTVMRAPIAESEKLLCYGLLCRYIGWKIQRASGLPIRTLKRQLRQYQASPSHG